VQGQTTGGASSQVVTQGAQRELPAKWSEVVSALAGKIAAAVKPARTTSLEVKNISSLEAADVDGICKALASELTSRGIRMAAGETGVNVTLSENAGGYVWVAEIRRNDTNGAALVRTAITSVPMVKVESAVEKKATLTLTRELVWQQPQKFLDFTVFYGIAGVQDSTLVILEADRLVYYASLNSNWRMWTTVALPRFEPGRRDPSGEIWVGGNSVFSNGVRCTGEIEHPSKVECELWDDVTIGQRWIGPVIPGHDGGVGATLADRCGNKSIALVSGDGDWTRPDSIQGYLLADDDVGAVSSGSPIEFDGPVMAIRGVTNGSLRVIVHNVKTGNYEGYNVTATCSQ
jgi:hypothetical protein